jgi:heme/copper-type cytochrome/quinol oxidase subunit 3
MTAILPESKVVADLSRLPMHGLGSASPTWWGTLGFMLLEGTAFALGIAIYLYLYTLALEWPLGAPVPDLGPGTALTLVLLASAVPNFLLSRWARKRELGKVRIGLVVMALAAIVPLILRWFEFPALHTLWDSNAYGSVTWSLLALHTTHLLTDLVETLVLTVLMFTRHGAGKRRFGDVEDNALYWNFVVIAWLPLYVCIYWIPRL